MSDWTKNFPSWSEDYRRWCFDQDAKTAETACNLYLAIKHLREAHGVTTNTAESWYSLDKAMDEFNYHWGYTE